MGKLFVIIAACWIVTPAQAEPLKPADNYCNHFTFWQPWNGAKCAWTAAAATGLPKHAKQLELEAEDTADPNKAQKLRNKAAFERLEADRYADEYRRKYAPRP